MTQGTATALGLSGHRLKIIKPGQQFSVGSFQIMPFAVQHDTIDPVGFLIESGGDKMLFATDTFYIRHKFPHLDIIAIECNYHLPFLDENISKGIYPRAVRNRVRKSHMSLDTCKAFLKAQDLEQVKEIWLLHLSTANADPAMFKDEIMKLTGKPVYIA